MIDPEVNFQLNSAWFSGEIIVRFVPSSVEPVVERIVPRLFADGQFLSQIFTKII